MYSCFHRGGLERRTRTGARPRYPGLHRSMSVLFALLFGLSTFSYARELKICADPDNLPFSNRQQQGFENRIAEVVARDLNAKLIYLWQRMGRGFVRDYLNSSQCDLLVGVPANFKPVLTTAPYYRSSYVFVSRRDGGFHPASLNDVSLHLHKIGVQVLDEDYTPPATALARRGLQNQIVGFDTTGDEADSIIRAVAEQKIDAAIVWGPLAGFFARNFANKLELTPVLPQVDPPALPLTFAISMAVRKSNTALRDELEAILERRRSDIQKILNDYGVPQLELAPASQGGS
jgi:mxaJ protein